MKKNILIVVIILAVTGYIAGVLTTKKLAEEQLPRMLTEFSEYHEVSINVEWLEQGFRSGKLRVYGENAVDDSMSLTFSEEVHLTYGFLSARWQGQGSSQFTSILADEPIAPYTYTSTGKVSRGGLFVDYAADEFKAEFDGMVFDIAPATVQVALVGNKVVADWQFPSVKIGTPGIDVLSMNDVKAHWGTQIRNGIAEVVDLRVDIGSMSFTGEQEQWQSDGIRYTFFMDLTRDMATLYGTTAMDIPFLEGRNEVDMEWRLNGILANDVIKIQQYFLTGEIDDFDLELVQSLNLETQEPELELKRFDGTSEQFGTLKMSGKVAVMLDFWLETLELLENDELVDYGWVMNGVRLDLTVAEMPPMMQMLLLTLPAEAQEMPLRVTIENGVLEANGFPIQ